MEWVALKFGVPFVHFGLCVMGRSRTKRLAQRRARLLIDMRNSRILRWATAEEGAEKAGQLRQTLSDKLTTPALLSAVPSVVRDSLEALVEHERAEEEDVADVHLSQAVLQHMKAKAERVASRPAPYIQPEITGLARICALSGGSKSYVFDRLRFSYETIMTLARRLLPETVTTRFKHGTVSGVDALTGVLLRFADPAFMRSHEETIGWADWKLSDVVQTTSQILYEKWADCLRCPRWLSENRLGNYAKLITALGCPDVSIVGFIDGTRRRVCRPRFGQSASYNGWLHNHTMLYIAIVFPDGTFLLRGPLTGAENDIEILQRTGLLKDLPTMLGLHSVGGDSIFPATLNLHPISGYDLPGLLPESSPLKELKSEYASVRIAVEWLFADITNTFRYFRNSDGQHALGTYPAQQYWAAAILSLARDCVYPNEIAQHLKGSPPSLDRVFNIQQ